MTHLWKSIFLFLCMVKLNTFQIVGKIFLFHLRDFFYFFSISCSLNQFFKKKKKIFFSFKPTKRLRVLGDSLFDLTLTRYIFENYRAVTPQFATEKQHVMRSKAILTKTVESIPQLHELILVTTFFLFF